EFQERTGNHAIHKSGRNGTKPFTQRWEGRCGQWCDDHGEWCGVCFFGCLRIHGCGRYTIAVHHFFCYRDLNQQLLGYFFSLRSASIVPWSLSSISVINQKMSSCSSSKPFSVSTSRSKMATSIMCCCMCLDRISKPFLVKSAKEAWPSIILSAASMTFRAIISSSVRSMGSLSFRY